jgi:glycosyltransferase involved in cell wall biosynthesis
VAVRTLPRVRLGIFCDFSYRRTDEGVWAELSFIRFLAGVLKGVDHGTLIGRLEPREAPWHHGVPDGIEFHPLPFYASLARPVEAARTMVGSLRSFWRVLDRVDAVWLFGPHPMAAAFAVLAATRRRPIALGIRQDFPAYTRTRHPGRRGLWLIALALEGFYRLVARRCTVVVVGPALARHYRHARDLLEITVSLASERDFADAPAAGERQGDHRRVLSVGRLDAEKNPLLLAAVLEELVKRDSRWRLSVCGDGALAGELAAELRRLGVDDHAELLGYIPVEEGLWDHYRSCDVLLHCAWTEGVPQVLFEAFAQRLPVIATAVGGVADAVGGAALLVPPGDAHSCADALEAVASDEELRTRLVAAGFRLAHEHSLEAETRRVAAFLTGAIESPRDSGQA